MSSLNEYIRLMFKSDEQQRDENDLVRGLMGKSTEKCFRARINFSAASACDNWLDRRSSGSTALRGTRVAPMGTETIGTLVEFEIQNPSLRESKYRMAAAVRCLKDFWWILRRDRRRFWGKAGEVRSEAYRTGYAVRRCEVRTVGT